MKLTPTFGTSTAGKNSRKRLTETLPGKTPSAGFLRVSNLSFAYQRFALEDLNFEIRSGEFATIIGPNGSGKSTLLRLLSGYLKPSQGRIELQGQSIQQMSLQERARTIALVAQESSLNFPLTVRELVLQGRHPHLSWFKFESEKDLQIVQWALEKTDLLTFAERKVSELSGGEKQRAVLARALAQQPRLLLLDEPTMNLDVGYQMDLISLIKSLSQQRDFNVVMVTHELNIGAEFSDCLALLSQGKLLAFGPPEAVLKQDRLVRVFRADLLVDHNPISGAPRVTPVRGVSERT